MSNLPINRSNFEVNKEKIKQFSANIPRPIKLNEVDEKRFFFFDHNVTGEEFNQLIQDLQKALKDSNEVDRKIIKEFGSIYDTFEALDKGYIQGICASVASADEASKQALAASENARAAQDKINLTLNVLQDAVQKYQKKFEVINLDMNLQRVLWEKVIADVEAYKNQIDTQSRTVMELTSKLDSSVEVYQAKLAAQNEAIAKLNNKIIYAYIVAVIAIVIACANFFVK